MVYFTLFSAKRKERHAESSQTERKTWKDGAMCTGIPDGVTHRPPEVGLERQEFKNDVVEADSSHRNTGWCHPPATGPEVGLERQEFKIDVAEADSSLSSAAFWIFVTDCLDSRGWTRHARIGHKHSK
jgi:hypothetical protein